MPIRSNALTVLKSGNVGIGTTTPTAKLHVNGGNIALSGGSFTLSGGNIAMGGGWLSNDGGNEGVFVTTTGRVGIGTNTPQAPLHVTGTTVTANGEGNYFKYDFGNNSTTQDIGSVNQVVGYFDGDLVASEGIISMNVSSWSDARAKHVLRRSDSREDLDLLNRIQITDYQWIDQVEDQGRMHKKVIAQEVEQVLPDAVSRMRKPIPNVYANAVKVDYNPAAKTLTVYLDKAHDFTVGDKVRVFTDQGDLDEAEVLSVSSPTIFVVSCDMEPSSAFVYGKWVDDYRKVDYDAIAMLNVSATQELAKKTEDLQQCCRTGSGKCSAESCV
ncbi:MAG: tail fiber domain-containing protein [Saprospirales bacterium]|nr:tail fiber domain-containing protein [Saprospirales bacterium]